MISSRFLSNTHQTTLADAARAALVGFMIRNPEMTPHGARCRFTAGLLPHPMLDHNAEWDDGDCTGRALQAWVYAREMTGDYETGRDIEESQRRYLYYCLHPEKGVVLRPDEPGEYWHMWDQGRTLRGLLTRASQGDEQMAEEAPRIRKMIEGLSAVAFRDEDPGFGEYAVFEGDGYRDGRPFQDYYQMRGGQLIDPLVQWVELTGDERALGFARELAAGVMSGREGQWAPDNYPREFVFGEDGSFVGHFHDHVSIVTGMARLGRLLAGVEGRELLNWSKRVYDWVLSDENPNRGSLAGWFPEGCYPEKVRVLSEVCCTTDMIELAAMLAGCSALHSDFGEWERLWDDVESMTLNGLIPSQFRAGEVADGLLERFGDDDWRANQAALEDIKNKLDGGWVWAYLPNDLAHVQEDGWTQMLLFGCCQYAGIAGIYRCWKEAAERHRSELTVRMHVSRELDGISILAEENEDALVVRIESRWPIRARVRVPAWAGGGWVIHDVTPDEPAVISFPWVERVTKERLGGPDTGQYFVQADEKPEYAIKWRGNRVVGIEPGGQFLRVH